jgi:hypothetical protein
MLTNARVRRITLWSLVLLMVVVTAIWFARGQPAANPSSVNQSLGAPAPPPQIAALSASGPSTSPVGQVIASATPAKSREVEVADKMSRIALTPKRFANMPFADVVKRLTADMANGDAQAPLDLANIYKLCRRSEKYFDATNSAVVAFSKLCIDVPARPERIDELVEIAVQRGNDAAVLEQHYYLPPYIVYKMRSEESGRWIRQMETRLTRLADLGNLDAHLQLAEIYRGKYHWQKNLAAAQQHLEIFLAQAPPERPDRISARYLLDRIVWMRKQPGES